MAKIVLNEVPATPLECPYCQRRNLRCWFTGDKCEFFGDNFKNCPACVKIKRPINQSEVKLK